MERTIQEYASLNGKKQQKPLYGTLLYGEELEIIFETMLDALIVYDVEGQLLFANAASRLLLGYSRQLDSTLTDTKRRITKLLIRDENGQPLPQENLPVFRVLRGETLEDGNAPDIMVRSLDGRELILNCYGVPRKNAYGEIIGAICILRDVTERRKAEQHINNALISLREANKRMDEFLSMASHELKTPLTAINGYISLAKEHLASIADCATITNDELAPIREMLERAERHGDLMHRLVNDLLDVSRILGSKLHYDLKCCNLSAIVYDIVKDQSCIVPQRAIYLKLPVGQKMPVFADADRIGQVVMNYLTNAFKYSPLDLPVEVRLQREHTCARVTVRDNGPGLSTIEQERIWQRFYQSHEIEVQNGTDGGLGLGLHICRTIIEYHHGQIGVNSTPGQGSSFWFTLPLQQGE
ncbi:MAG TPA: PAS domain-containing sensor histidine kinase [Ktedonobacteraceae bacterium]|nr:PAS domain-containing sensor histidine kinase [Ktedonobacteraceae bacterium]